MYPLGSLTAALQNARRKLLDVIESPDSEATREQRTQGMGKRARVNWAFDANEEPNGDSSIRGNCDCNLGARNNSRCTIQPWLR
jgi:hypothetical protein